MEKKEFYEFLFEELKKNNIKNNINEDKCEMLYKYMNNIIEWNEKINVTAITDCKMFIVKHFVDSLTISQYIKGTEKIIDIGTGAGFPGIPLKIDNENVDITLLDSVNKKLNVIRESIKEFDINNINIIHARAEDLANNDLYREKYDVATTRAVSNLSTILEYMMPFIKIGGCAICMKGPNFEEELDNAKKAINILGGKFEKKETIKIDNEIDRNIIIIKKIKETPKKYPRNAGKPLKEPIV